MNISNNKLRQLCIENNWFTCGDNEQYEKLFSENRKGTNTERLALIIWVCSENCSEAKIRTILDKECGVNDASIEELSLSTRVENALMRSEIYTIKELLKHSEVQIKELRGIGAGGVNEIKKALSCKSLVLHQ